MTEVKEIDWYTLAAVGIVGGLVAIFLAYFLNTTLGVRYFAFLGAVGAILAVLWGADAVRRICKYGIGTGVPSIGMLAFGMGLLATLNVVFRLLITLLYSLLFLLMMPVLWLMSLLSRGDTRPPVQESLPPPQFPQIPESQPSAPAPWLEILKSAIFWAIFLGLVGYAFTQYIRQNQALMEKLRKIRLFNWLAGTWKWLQGILKGWNEGLGAAVQAGLQRLRQRREITRATIARRFVNPRRLSPRQQVMFFYLALVRRGGESGLPRQPSQTPAEYARFLQTRLPEADEDVGAITDSFVEARYTPHEIPPDRAGAVRQVWDRLKHALRKRGKPV